jgi:hypothetical protein
LVTKNQWKNCQDSYSIPIRSQFRSSDSLLGAPPHRSNPSSAQLCKKDKGKRVVNEIEDCLEMRGKLPITDWIKMKQNLQEKYLPQSYRNKLLDQWNNLR